MSPALFALSVSSDDEPLSLLRRRAPRSAAETHAEAAVRLRHRRVALSCTARDQGSCDVHLAVDVEAGIAVLADGWLTDVDALARRLGCSRPVPATADASLLLRAYQHLGDSFVDELNGHFCAVVVDANRAEMVAAVDPFRTHPLYARQVGRAWYVGTSARALAAIPPTSAVRPESLLEVLHRQELRPPATMFDGIHAIEPGTIVELGRKPRRYWTWAPEPEPMNPDQAITAVETALAAVTATTEHVHVPCYVTTSGGIDSSLIAAFSHRGGCEFTPTVVSVDWAANAMNETDKARIVAETLGRELRIVRVEFDQFPAQLAAHLAAMDQPCPLGLGISLLTQTSELHGEVGLTGLGSDELFFGYPEVNCRLFGRTTHDVIDAYLELSALFPVQTMERMGAAMGVAFGPVRAQLRDRLFADVREAAGNSAETTAALLINRFLIPGDVYSYSLFGASHGARLRHPFLDRRVTAVARRISTEISAAGAHRVGKPLLRTVAERIGLPRSIFAAPKHGFGVPAMGLVIRAGEPCRWFREPSRKHPLSQILQQDPLFDSRPVTSSALSAYRLWTRLLLTHWLEARCPSGDDA